MGQFHWDPDGYLAMMREEVPDYERLQDETAAATGAGAQRLLELGTGTGETARRVLARHPAAVLVGLDASRRECCDRRRVEPVLPARSLGCSSVLRPRATRAEDPADVVTPIDGDYDRPSTVGEQLRWLAAAGLQASVAWARRDLAVLVGQAPGPR